jgi:uncharacterized protein DUF6484
MRQGARDELLEVILTQDDTETRVETSSPKPCYGTIIGEFLGWGENGEPLVKSDADPTQASVPAKATVVLGQRDIGRNVVLVFENGDPLRPIIMGVIQSPAGTKPQISTSSQSFPFGLVEADGETFVFTAQRKIVLKCGKSSITLTQDGRVLIRGTYLSSQSSGPNLIKGGSVQLN